MTPSPDRDERPSSNNLSVGLAVGGTGSVSPSSWQPPRSKPKEKKRRESSGPQRLIAGLLSVVPNGTTVQIEFLLVLMLALMLVLVLLLSGAVLVLVISAAVIVIVIDVALCAGGSAGASPYRIARKFHGSLASCVHRSFPTPLCALRDLCVKPPPPQLARSFAKLSPSTNLEILLPGTLR